MTNYSNGKIYKIEPIQGGDIYIGSTTKKYLCERMTKHRTDYKRWKSQQMNKLMVFDIFEKYGIDKCKIVLIESFHAKNKEELLSREAHYIRTLECVNKHIPNRSRKEWEEDNHEKLHQYRENYYENNKEAIIARLKEAVVCECGCEVWKCNLIRHKKTKKHLDRMNNLNDELIV